MDKVFVDWFDISNEEVEKYVKNKQFYNNKSSPSTYIKNKIINDLIKSLTNEERELIILHFYENYSLREIAKIYKVNYLQVFKRIRKIIDKMREVFYAKIDVLQNE